MLLQCFLIILSILYGTLGQVTVKSPLNATASTPATNVTTVSPPEAEERSPDICRNDTEWQCDSRCIDIDKKCDGVFDCVDLSDEDLSTCRDEKPRPLFGLILYCSSFWSDRHESVCPQICQKSPEFCYYALMAENHENHTCLLPDFPVNGTYLVMPSNSTSIPGLVNFWLNFTCEKPYVMVQKKLLSCTNGEWENDPKDNGYCSEACQLFKNDNFTYNCPVDVYGEMDCGDYVPIKTIIRVSRVSQDDSPAKNVSLELLCSEARQFNFSTDCVQKVDTMQQDFENPTMLKMTHYERQFNQFKSNETNNSFEDLVTEFHKFEKEVRGNLSLMHTMAEQCDISLDLLLYNLQQNQRMKEEKDKNP